MMISRVVAYRPLSSNTERFVMIFAQDSLAPGQATNETATRLLKTATTPTHVNTPFQGWKFDKFPIEMKDYIVNQVHGKAMFVREKIIEGRWQLVSIV